MALNAFSLFIISPWSLLSFLSPHAFRGSSLDASKRQRKKLIFLEKCIQHLIEAWREPEQRTLTNLLSNFFLFMENLETKSVCALQTSIYLVTYFSDTRHYNRVRIAVGWNRIRWCGCLSFRIDVHLLHIKRIYLVTKYQHGKFCSDGRVANSASGVYQSLFQTG